MDSAILIPENRKRIRGLSQEVVSAIQFIREHFRTIKSVRDVASAIQVEYNTLRGKFRRETRQTLIEYLTRIRLENARAMFREDLLLKEIAWKVGYAYENQFIRAFVKNYGKTPREVRAHQINGSRTNQFLSTLSSERIKNHDQKR